MRTHVCLFAGIAVVLAMTAFSCKKKDAVQQKPPEIPVVNPIIKDLPITADFVGQTYGIADIDIRARVEGFLQGIYFKEGTAVRKGQLLYSIDPQPFEAKVAEQVSRLAGAQTQLVKAESDLNRIRPLAENNAVSQSDLDAAIAQHDAAMSSLDAANAQLELAKIELGYTKIYSPVNGIIGITNAKIGDFVGRSLGATTLNTVSKIDTILVRFAITETQYLQLTRYQLAKQALGQEVTNSREPNLDLILADGSIHTHKGILDVVNSQVDPTTGTLLIQALFPNPEKLLRPGQFAKVRAVIELVENGILIPQRCATELQGKYFVYTVNEQNEVQSNPIKIDHTMPGLYLVSEGIKPGDKIIYEGLQKVRGGVKVTPILQDSIPTNF